MAEMLDLTPSARTQAQGWGRWGFSTQGPEAPRNAPGLDKLKREARARAGLEEEPEQSESVAEQPEAFEATLPNLSGSASKFYRSVQEARGPGQLNDVFSEYGLQASGFIGKQDMLEWLEEYERQATEQHQRAEKKDWKQQYSAGPGSAVSESGEGGGLVDSVDELTGKLAALQHSFTHDAMIERKKLRAILRAKLKAEG